MLELKAEFYYWIWIAWFSSISNSLWIRSERERKRSASCKNFRDQPVKVFFLVMFTIQWQSRWLFMCEAALMLISLKFISTWFHFIPPRTTRHNSIVKDFSKKDRKNLSKSLPHLLSHSLFLLFLSCFKTFDDVHYVYDFMYTSQVYVMMALAVSFSDCFWHQIYVFNSWHLQKSNFINFAFNLFIFIQKS